MVLSLFSRFSNPAQDGEVLCGFADPDSAVIFPKRDIEYPVHAVSIPQ